MSLLLAVLMQVGPNPVAPELEALPLAPPTRERNTDKAQLPDTLRRCLSEVREDPARAHVRAQLARNAATGEDRVFAGHCLALAALELGRPAEALTVLTESLALVPSEAPGYRARLAVMAANAALVAGDPHAALPLLDQAAAAAHASGDPDLLGLVALDRGRARMIAGDTATAATAFAEARAAMPDSAEALFLSAVLARRSEHMGEARAWIEQAAALEPADQQIALEAGLIAALAGRDDAARTSWQKVIEHDPVSEAARIARAYLAQLAPEAGG